MSGAAAPSAGAGHGELIRRILSGAVLAAVALGEAWLGGWWLAAFWSLAAAGVLYEWLVLVRGQGLAWQAGGVVYAALVVVSPVVLGLDPAWGFAALCWLFAVVWGCDVMAYVFGRLIGGPKLMPRVSPKKTWAGFIGGVSSATALGTLVAHLAAAPRLWPVAVLSAAAAAFSQGGDLFESWLKRRFGVKDSSNLIPGHGGLMDRLDGFIAAGLLAVLVGVARAGVEMAAQGVLRW